MIDTIHNNEIKTGKFQEYTRKNQLMNLFNSNEGNVVEQKFVLWNSIKEEEDPPRPHYIDPNSEIEVKIYDNGIIEVSGYCLFPGDDETLRERKQANHFHGIQVLKDAFIKAIETEYDDVTREINVLWNAARVVKKDMDWKSMISVKTKNETYAAKPIEKDKKYKFNAILKPIKDAFKDVAFKIVDENGVVMFMATSRVMVEQTQKVDVNLM